MNIILSIYLQTVKNKITRENVEGDTINNCKNFKTSGVTVPGKTCKNFHK